MTVVDSSVLIAILFEEADAAALAARLAAVEEPVMSVVNLVEASVVADSNRNPRKGPALDDLIAKAGIELVAVDVPQAKEAREAYRRYGKGNHPARLNLGDCFAYALAKSRGTPLLYKGNDFDLTDIGQSES